MSELNVPPFIYVRDRQNNSDLMIATSAIRYITQNDRGHVAITFIGGGTQEVVHTIPELAQMMNGNSAQAQEDLNASRALVDERAPSVDPYDYEDDSSLPPELDGDPSVPDL